MAPARINLDTRAGRRKAAGVLGAQYAPEGTDVWMGLGDPTPLLLAIIGAELCAIGAAAEKIAKALDKRTASAKAEKVT